MSLPFPITTRAVSPDTHAIGTFLPLPGLGVLPVNAFVIQAREPVLVDTGVVAMGEPFFEAIAETIDLADLRWLFLTHADADHIGALARVLERAPQVRLATAMLTVGKLGLAGMQIPEERLHLVKPGDRLPVGDRDLVVLRPPVFDAPETLGVFDPRTRTLFSSDSFGGLLAGPAADAREVDATALREGMVAWAQIDAPWLSVADPAAFAGTVDLVRRTAPDRVLSGHLPPAAQMTSTLVANLLAARAAAPGAVPDTSAVQEALAAR